MELKFVNILIYDIFNGGDKDSAVIDIAIYDISVHGEKGSLKSFLRLIRFH